MKRIDLEGKRFGRLIVTESKHIKGRLFWKCTCDCGNETTIVSGSLRNGGTKSCGCLSRELVSKRSKIHGQAVGKKTVEYFTWSRMRGRCNNVNNPDYLDYGGRGITVSSEWNTNFVQFYTDMGLRPSNKHSLDRIDVNGNYCKENCRWSTPEQQGLNKRNNVWITYEGETKTVRQWGEYLGIPKLTIYGRFNSGLNLDDVFYKGSLKTKKKDQLVSLRQEIESLKANQ